MSNAYKLSLYVVSYSVFHVFYLIWYWVSQAIHVLFFLIYEDFNYTLKEVDPFLKEGRSLHLQMRSLPLLLF